MRDPALLDLAHDGAAIIPGHFDRAACVALIRALPAPHGRRGGVRLALDDLLRGAASDPLESLTRLANTLAPLDDGTALRAVRAILFDKHADANWLVPWHQDLTVALAERNDAARDFGPWSTKSGVVHAQAPASLLERMITLRLHLDDCPAENGALIVEPRSHRDGITSARPERTAPVICTVRAGDGVAMRPLLWHSSSRSTVPAHRRVLHVEFGPPVPGPGVRWASDHALTG